jgi:hypothetical protein
MQFYPKMNKIFLLVVGVLLTAGGISGAGEKLIELKFKQPPVMESDESRTLQSLVKARDIGETYSTGGLYLLTHFGDRKHLFEKENRKCIENPMINHTWRFCSVFSASSENSAVMGRNWDNQNVGSVIISSYHPNGGYASVSFSRSIDLGFPLNLDLEQIKSSEWESRLLLAPFYAMDGINEQGLAVAVTGVRQTAIKPIAGKELIFVSFLVRKILDQARDIEEAVSLAENFIPFDLDKNALNCHFFIADVSGRSVIMEVEHDHWQKQYGNKSWQVLTNKPVFNVPDATLREKCWRYRSICESLEKTGGTVDWQVGMKILQDVSQKGTTWSVVYSPRTKELHFTVYQQWNKPYHLGMF